MSIAECDSPIGAAGHEDQIHMDMRFPIVCYYDDLQQSPVSWHWHDELELLIVTQGCIIAADEQNKYTIARGDGMFVNAGVMHSMRQKGSGTCRLHSMVFSTRLLSGADQIFYERYINPIQENRSLQSLILHKENAWQTRILAGAEAAWELCRDEPQGYEWMVRSHLSDAVFILWKNMPPSAGRSSIYSVRSQRMKIMIRYIREHYMNPITLADLSREAAISESEVIRCFTGVAKTTPIRFLREYRLEKGAELLRSSSGNVTMVAAQCGFTDPGYFIREFRRKYHCTPGQFRRGIS